MSPPPSPPPQPPQPPQPPSQPEDDWIFDPSLASINRSIQRELREEAEEVEGIVAEAELRERRFADVARHFANRGDVVSLAVTRRTFTGQITYAAGDFVTLTTESSEVDINLDAIASLRVIRPGNQGGRAIGDGPGTFEMRLIERRSPFDLVELGYRSQDELLLGHIHAVGQDHLMILDEHQQEWIIPLAAIAYVVRRTGQRRRR